MLVKYCTCSNPTLGGSDSAYLECHIGVCNYINSIINSDVPHLKGAAIFENIIYYVIWFQNLCSTGHGIFSPMDLYRFGANNENY